MRLTPDSTSKVRPKTSTSVSPKARSQISSIAARSSSAALRTSKSTGAGCMCAAQVTVIRASPSGRSLPQVGQRYCGNGNSNASSMLAELLVGGGPVSGRIPLYRDATAGARSRPADGIGQRRGRSSSSAVSSPHGQTAASHATTPAALEALVARRGALHRPRRHAARPGGSVVADAAGAPSAATVEAIVALNRAGLTVVPVSGRTRLQLTEVVRLLGWTRLHRRGRLRCSCAAAGPGRRVDLQHRRVARAPARRRTRRPTSSSATRVHSRRCRRRFPGGSSTTRPGTATARRPTCCAAASTWPRRRTCSTRSTCRSSLLDNGRRAPSDARARLHRARRTPTTSCRAASARRRRSRSTSPSGASRRARPRPSATRRPTSRWPTRVGLMALVDNAFESASVREALADQTPSASCG